MHTPRTNHHTFTAYARKDADAPPISAVPAYVASQLELETQVLSAAKQELDTILNSGAHDASASDLKPFGGKTVREMLHRVQVLIFASAGWDFYSVEKGDNTPSGRYHESISNCSWDWESHDYQVAIPTIPEGWCLVRLWDQLGPANAYRHLVSYDSTQRDWVPASVPCHRFHTDVSIIYIREL